MPDTPNENWWRNAVIYQVYPRSFADGNGDGIGDLAGLRRRLPYLRSLGVDAIWVNPWYASPQADAGYDVSDYRAIDPLFGTLAGAEQLIVEANAQGLKVIVDVVPNHVSREHPWFQTALRGTGRDRFWFRDRPANNWVSQFGGGTWTQVPDGQWYLHLFDAAQPDLNWNHPEVRAEFEDVLRFWFDRGAAGIRVDSAALLAKDPELPEVDEPADINNAAHPFIDRDEVHEVYRSWRRIADEYGGRTLVGEVWLPDPERLSNYVRPDELHTVFNLPFLECPWDAARLREVIEQTCAMHDAVGAPPTWVLSNHDVTRLVTRYGRADTSFSFAAKLHTAAAPISVDLELGARRARAAALLLLALPGSAYLYQGEELGLWEVEDIPPELRQDPMWHRSGNADPGRDGCRVPLPWSGDQPSFGFSDSGRSWLPQPEAWKAYTVAAQTGDPASMLELYRSALRLRREFRDAPMAWANASPQMLAFDRGGLRCVVNLGPAPVELPPHTRALLASAPIRQQLPPDTAVWLAL